MGADFSNLAGDPALDLVNTVSWRLDPARASEDLVDYGAVLRWSRQFDQIRDKELEALMGQATTAPDAAEAVRRDVLALRDTLHDLVTHEPSARLSHLAAAFRAAIADTELEDRDGRLAWVDSRLTLTTPLHRMARVAVDLVTSTDLARVRRCADDACGYVYLDTSPRRNRRWCSAQDCGNRNRVRRHYRNRRTATGREPGRTADA